ncbi:cytochrome ubiquinol oxidase subunit I [Priestia megaterium]|uniref:cytochrome ubiquinol oxidase subunit I n=1 Tax=Priestia megaterium TaxID=1404 RepID=UPI000BF4C59F|nr:cytochrome ubiquinol oxidase subunit I [Priestia megaterium]PFE02778.1 cytochrome ubiquinol oxidase subunit I [Priestia megaterium]
MDHLVTARSIFGLNMGVHIIFATLGVGIPLMILLAEILYYKTKDKDYELMAQRWTKGAAVLLGVAIPTGTIAGVQLALLWPGFMEIVGKVMALPFQIEIYAFFIEALFLSIYVYAADRISRKMRIISLILVAIGALASAVLITNVHAFEGTPAGFRILNGDIVSVDPWAAFFNPSFFVTSGHVAVSAYTTGGFVIASVAAFKMLRARKHNPREYKFHHKALMMGLVIGGIFSFVTALNGHESMQKVYEYQPEKLAAAEGLFETQDHAPLALGGFTDEKEQRVKYGIEFPWMLSFLSGNSFNTVITGLNDFPRDYWPPLFVHTLFNGMVIIGSILILVALVGVVWYKFLKKKSFPKIFMWAFVATGPLAIMGIEFGWIFACTGRQPWVIYRIMRTSEAVTTSANLHILFFLFLLVYIVLVAAVALVLVFYFRRNPLSKELAAQAD